MNKVQKIRAVYAELSATFAGELTPRELLVLAKRLCDAYDDPQNDGYEYVSTGPVSGWPAVDVAISDGGWSQFVHAAAANDNSDFEDGRAHTSVWRSSLALRRYA